MQPAQAHADAEVDAKFLAYMEDRGFATDSGAAGLIGNAKSVCGALSRQPVSLDAVRMAAESVHEQTILTFNNSLEFVAASIWAYCPWNDPLPKQPTVNNRMGGKFA